jgi:hypothetical protein
MHARSGAFRGAVPDAVVNATGEAIFQAGGTDRAVGADLAGDLDAGAVTGEEQAGGRWRQRARGNQVARLGSFLAAAIFLFMSGRPLVADPIRVAHRLVVGLIIVGES